MIRNPNIVKDKYTPRQLKRLIKKAGYRQSDFSARLGIAPSTLSLFLNGIASSRPTYEKTIKELGLC